MKLSRDEKAAFALLAEEVFALDTAIQWFVLERESRPRTLLRETRRRDWQSVCGGDNVCYRTC
jgi:hypothetical protein